MKRLPFVISVAYFLIAITWFIFTYQASLYGPVAEETDFPHLLNILLLIILSSLLLYFIARGRPAKVKYSEAQYHQLFEDNPQPMWIFKQQDLEILAVNTAAMEIYGYSREEFTGMNLKELIADEDVPQLEQALLQAPPLRTFKDKLVIRHKKKDGELFYTQISSRQITFNGVADRLVLALNIDVQHRAHLKIKDLNHKLKNIRKALSASSIVLRLNREGEVQFMNGKFISIFQIGEEDFYQPKIHEDIWNEFSPIRKARIVHTVQQGRIWQGEIKVANRAQKAFWIDTKIIPVKNDQQIIEEFFVIGYDISDKKKTEEALIQREQLFRSLIDSYSSYLVRIEPEGGYTYANPRFLQKFGFTMEELKATTFEQMVLPEDLAEYQKAARFCRENPEQIVVLEIPMPDKEGNINWSSWEFVGIAGKEGTTSVIQGLGRDISPQKRAELDLQKYTRRLDLVLDSIGEGFFNMDLNWKLLKVNKEFERLTGKKRNEVQGLYLLEVLPFMTDSPFYPYLEAALEEGVPMRFEEYSTQLNKWLEVNLFPYQDGLSGYFRDVSKKKKTELEVKQALLRFDTLTKATYDTIWEWDLLKQKVRWNDGLFRNFGYSTMEVQDTPEWRKSKIHPDDFDSVVNGIHNHIEQKKGAWTAEYRFQAADGSYRFVLDRGYVIYNENEMPVLMIGAIQDIHQEREYQEEIKKLSLVARKTQNSVIITDKDGYIEWVNESFSQLCGYTLEEVKGKRPGNFLQGPQTDPEAITRIRRLLEQKVEFSEEIINYSKDGTPYWVRMDISPVLDEDGKLIKFIAIETDITERKKFEQRLQQQNEQLKEIAWISSHEIRGPVASILGLISLYDHGFPEASFNKEILQHLLNVSQQLDKVIHRIVNKTFEVDELEDRKQDRQGE
ncbi:PAS domain S-box protein [Nafulsella turpanensis]|uniref:PAS domain S-box protein n=1 Tax=Nafulsella turpanensis TaxID=1265690 RepID=UPI00135F17F3|nr:PAS domain S-box protein [Nafulsella turpanensis]